MTYPTNYHEAMQQSECLYTQSDICNALDKMASVMTDQLADQHPIFLAVMTGALVVTGHLLPRLHFPLQLDYVHATRYRGAVRGGDLHWMVEPRLPLKDRTVVVVDDILDGGLTLAAIMDYCQQMGAQKVYSAVMINKKRVREPGVVIEPDFAALETENRFLFGFGLDYEEELRNAPGVYAFK